MDKQVLSVSQIIIGLMLILLIMIQAKGGGLGSTFGGLGGFYRSKRGLEKIIYYVTVFAACVFFLLSAVNFIFFS